MLFTDFYSILPSIGAYYTVGTYSTTKLSHLTYLHYRITPSTKVTSKVTFSYDIFYGFQFQRSGVVFAFFLLKC